MYIPWGKSGGICDALSLVLTRDLGLRTRALTYGWLIGNYAIHAITLM